MFELARSRNELIIRKRVRETEYTRKMSNSAVLRMCVHTHYYVLENNCRPPPPGNCVTRHHAPCSYNRSYIRRVRRRRGRSSKWRHDGCVEVVCAKAVRGRWTGYRIRGNRLPAHRKRPRGAPQRTRAHERILHFFLAPDHERKSTSKNCDRVIKETRSPTIFFFLLYTIFSV